MSDESLQQDLQRLQGKRIFFGHQSVGANILQGVKEQLSEHKGITLNFQTLSDTASAQGPFFGDSFVGKNGQPDLKCDEFKRIVQRHADSLDVAVVKFCFVDIRKASKVEEIFRYYRNTMEELKATCPRVKFVHVTTPLSSRTGGLKRFVKQLLGREDDTDADNMRRTEFNSLLLEQYSREPVFDLTKLESTFPDGARSSFELGGKSGYSLVEEYTDDGGHLNQLGRRLAAREFVRVLASAVSP